MPRSSTLAFLSILTLSLSCELVLTCHAAEPIAHRDLYYTAEKSALQSLDLYTPAVGDKHPLVVWIHGGGWKKGDKASLQHKPQALADKGYALVSLNYRLVPTVTLREMMADLAKGIRWVQLHAADYHCDGSRIVVMGHSSGAHVAALLCTDDSYLKAEGSDLHSLRGCVPIDVSAYDLPKHLKDGGSTPVANYTSVFGESEAEQRAFSPAYFVAKDKGIPPFLLLHVASREDTKRQAHWLAEKLGAAAVQAQVFAGEGKTHGSIGSDIGLAGDAPTEAIFAFLARVMAR